MAGIQVIKIHFFLQPTFHRVLLGTQARMSIPFFLEAVPEFVLDPKDLVPDEDRQFDPITYKEHILYTNSTFKEYQRDQ